MTITRRQKEAHRLAALHGATITVKPGLEIRLRLPEGRVWRYGCSCLMVVDSWGDALDVLNKGTADAAKTTKKFLGALQNLKVQR